MKRILACVPAASDGCAFYRGVGVLGELRRFNIDLQVISRNVSWTDMSTCDIGFMQRPYKGVHIEIARMIKEQGPLWIDYDDNLFAIPMDNAAYSTYMTAEVHKNLSTLLNLADIVTVSTTALKEALTPYSSNIQVLPNAYNDYRLSTDKVVPREKTVLWRGTSTHANDLMYYKSAFETLFQEFSDFKFLFIGMAPWMLDTKAANVAFITPQSLFQYFETINKVAPSYVVVPLIDNDLNRCKSNIAWIETMRSNSLVVAPDYPEWNQGGIWHYEPGNVESFLDICRTVFTLGDPTVSSTHLYSATRDFLLSSINSERVQLINKYTW